jgi:hypothetical protein
MRQRLSARAGLRVASDASDIVIRSAFPTAVVDHLEGDEKHENGGAQEINGRSGIKQPAGEIVKVAL